MHLTKIVLEGFKSFASKTTLEFKPGITAIVGPNGSGKSNLADAIRWVLGEQSYKALRSKQSEDIIFSGSKEKNRLSKASVFLFLDNQDKKIPLDFSEVVIGRRFYRNGETDYLINNARVRLFDLKDILIQAGFGQKTYSVINQGMADHLINSTPLQRRELFEEAAQIKPYQFKRDQSQNKLLKTKENLRRLEDTLRELKPHLVFLKKQMIKKKKREKVEKQLKLLKIKFFKLKFSLFKQRLAYLEEDSQKTKKEHHQKIELHQKIKQSLNLSQKKFAESSKKIEQIFSLIESARFQKNKKEEELAIMQGTLKAKALKSEALEKMLKRERRDLLQEEQKEKIKIIDLLNQEKKDLIEKINQLKKKQTQKNLPLNTKIKNLIHKFRKLKESIKQALAAPHPQIHQKMQALLNSIEKDLKSLREVKNNKENIYITLQANLNNLKNQISKERKELREVNLKLKTISLAPQKETKRENIKADQAEIDRLAKVVLKLKNKICALEKEKELTEKDERRLKAKIFEQERRERLLQAELEDYKISYNEALKKIKTTQENLEVIKKQAEQEAGLVLKKEMIQPLKKTQNLQKIEQQINRLSQTLLVLPLVDQETIQAFQENQKKYDFLLKEKQDLDKATDSLKNIIKKLNQIIQEKFDRSFSAINQEFKKYFRILFNGGTAGLKIESLNPNLMPKNKLFLSSFQKIGLQKNGIEIKAVPPGKKLKNIHMLSGGEKALTSLALLFAVFNINPTPFCVLDEVDAALDEANSIKFAKILKRLSNKTQFLAISHNRETMRQANCLYGVTMSKDGVSKIISLSLTSAEEYANNN